MTSDEWYEDAWGRVSRTQQTCMMCGGSGIEYEETCVTCGGFGFVCESDREAAFYSENQQK